MVFIDVLASAPMAIASKFWSSRFSVFFAYSRWSSRFSVFVARNQTSREVRSARTA